MPDPNSPDGPKGIYVLPEADISGVKKQYPDLIYGTESAFQKLDLYLPDTEPPTDGYPLVVFIHGGAWMMCDKRDVQLKPALKAVGAGFAVASVNYRLSSEAIFPAPIQDVKAAVHYLRHRAGDFTLDGRRIAAWGCSAGAHLASLAGTTSGTGLFEPRASAPSEQGSSVQAVVSWFGPTDFLLMDRYLAETGNGIPDHTSPESPESRLLGGLISERPEAVREANPETYLTKNCPPFLLMHGDRDSIVPHQMSEVFAGRINNVAGPGRAELLILNGADHAGSEFESAENVKRVLTFLKKHLT